MRATVSIRHSYKYLIGKILMYIDLTTTLNILSTIQNIVEGHSLFSSPSLRITHVIKGNLWNLIDSFFLFEFKFLLHVFLNIVSNNTNNFLTKKNRKLLKYFITVFIFGICSSFILLLILYVNIKYLSTCQVVKHLMFGRAE